MEKLEIKSINIRNPEAIKLIRQRAKAEVRSLANAGAKTIIEALGNNKILKDESNTEEYQNQR